MKKFINYWHILAFILIYINGSCALAQVDKNEILVKKETTASKELKNLIKINLLALPLKNISLEYERVLTKKISFGMGLRIMPQSQLPFISTIKNLAEDDESKDQLGDIRLGNFAITPEVRFYLGKNILRGFYIAPFARIASYSITLPVQVDVEKQNGTTQQETIPLDGKINTITGGILLGAQWKLGKRIYLDWWILGPQYGSSNGNININRSFSADEQKSVRSALEDIDIPLVKTSTTVDANHAKLDFSGPWAGLRSGLCLGYRF